MAPQNGWFYLRTTEVRLIHIPVAMSWWRLRMVQDSSTCMKPKWDIATIIVCTHPSPFLLVGVEPPTKFRKGGGLDRISILRGGLLGKMEVTSFGRGGGCSFFIKVLIVGVYWKIRFLGGVGFWKNQYIGGSLAKKREVDTLMHTMYNVTCRVVCHLSYLLSRVLSDWNPASVMLGLRILRASGNLWAIAGNNAYETIPNSL